MRKPRKNSKRRLILDAGTEIFLAAGYDAASMDRIARCAGVSKITIYKHFANKEDLFTQIVTEICDDVLAPLWTDAMARGKPARDGLLSLARTLLQTLSDRKAMDLYRLVIAETGRFPEVGAAYFAGGQQRAHDNLARWLEARTRQGQLTVDAPDQAASLFIGMVTGSFLSKYLVMPAATDPPDCLEAHAQDAVRMFLALYGA